MQSIHNEFLRKGVHAGLAVCFAVLAIYFDKESIIGVGLALFAFLVLFRFSHISSCMHNVPRITFGELFFALGVVASAYLAYPNVHLFQLSMGILAFADTFAALVGMRFGKHRYTVVDEIRSLEGSLTCFFVSLAILIFFGVSFFTALFFAIMLTSIEAVSLRGSDNLFLPTSVVLLFHFFVM